MILAWYSVRHAPSVKFSCSYSNFSFKYRCDFFNFAVRAHEATRRTRPSEVAERADLLSANLRASNTNAFTHFVCRTRTSTILWTRPHLLSNDSLFSFSLLYCTHVFWIPSRMKALKSCGVELKLRISLETTQQLLIYILLYGSSLSIFGPSTTLFGNFHFSRFLMSSCS